MFTEKDRREEQSAQKAGQVGEDIDHMGKANKIISIMKGQVTPGALQWLQSAMVGGLLEVLKVTVDLQGCLPKNHSHARVLCYNHRKVYIIVKVIKCRIIRNNFFMDLI